MVEARKESLGPGAVDTLDSILSLATLLGEQGGYSDGGQARMLLEETAAGYETALRTVIPTLSSDAPHPSPT